MRGESIVHSGLHVALMPVSRKISLHVMTKPCWGMSHSRGISEDWRMTLVVLLLVVKQTKCLDLYHNFYKFVCELAPEFNSTSSRNRSIAFLPQLVYQLR